MLKVSPPFMILFQTHSVGGAIVKHMTVLKQPLFLGESSQRRWRFKTTRPKTFYCCNAITHFLVEVHLVIVIIAFLSLLHVCFAGGGGDAEEDEVAVELQGTVLVSAIEGDDGMEVHGFAPEELVIQDGMEDVVAEYVQCTQEEDEGLGSVAVETCVMSPDEGLEDEGLQVDVLTAAEVQEDPDACGNYLMISCECHNRAVGLHSPSSANL